MDVKLLKLAQKGNDDAFFQLISWHKEQLYRTAFSYLKNEQDSLEAIQEVTFRAYKNIKKVKEPKYLQTWLVRIMINYCIDELKRKKRIQLEHIQLHNASIIEDKDRHLGIEEAVMSLEPKLQEVIILKYFEGMTIEQIAENLGHPSGTIKTWLNKALKNLRKQFEKEEGSSV